MMIFIIIITIIVILWTSYYLKNKRKFFLGEQFPGPKAVPLFGNVLQMLNKNPNRLMRSMNKTVERYGDFFRVWHGHKLFFWATDPKKIEIVLSNSTKYLSKNKEYNFIVPWLGYGLLLSSGKKWHGRRKIITPAFHFKILENFITIFDQQSSILVERLQKQNNGECFNVEPFITLFTLDVVCETAMGTQLKAQSDTEKEYVKAVSTISDILTARFVKIWQKNDLLFKIFARKEKQKQDAAIKILHDFTDSIIKKRRQQLIDQMETEQIKKDNDNDPDDDVQVNKKEALLDILLKSTIEGKSLSNADIREEVDTFMFEGHDTTTASICFTLHLLSRHQEIQNKLFNEIKNVIGTDKNSPISYRELQDLKYLEYVIKESLRLYPSVPMYGREIEEDIILGKDQVIPAGSTFAIPVYIMHRKEKYFPKPNEFIPERFESGHEYSIEHLNPFTYLPFSAGSRNCIGQKFAMLEMKSTIAKILRHYKLIEKGEEPQPVIALVIRSTNGIQIGLKDRVY